MIRFLTILVLALALYVGTLVVRDHSPSSLPQTAPVSVPSGPFVSVGKPAWPGPNAKPATRRLR